MSFESWNFITGGEKSALGIIQNTFSNLQEGPVLVNIFADLLREMCDITYQILL